VVDCAEKVADGSRPAKKDRFVRLGTVPDGHAVDWDLVYRAARLAGLKGYVTNIAPETMNGQTDLRARPTFHHTRDSIEAPHDRVRRPRHRP
jgi:hypothetical protein